MLINILDAIFRNCAFTKNEISFGEYSCFFYHNISKSDFFILLAQLSHIKPSSFLV